jgi:hypothetical protein
MRSTAGRKGSEIADVELEQMTQMGSQSLEIMDMMEWV